MRVAIDVDGVLADIIGTWIQAYSLPFKKTDVTEYDFGNLKHYGVTLESFLVAHKTLWEIGAVMPTMINLATKVPEIDFDIVTARPRGGCDDVKVWLDKQKVKYGKIVCVDKAVEKSILNYDVYIDDHPTMYEAMREGQIQIMINQPWNISVQHEQVIRAMNLGHATMILRGLTNAETR